MRFGEFFSRPQNTFFFAEKRRVFEVGNKSDAITLDSNSTEIEEMLAAATTRYEIPESPSQEKTKIFEEAFGLRSLSSRIDDLVHQKGWKLTEDTKALFMAALDAKHSGGYKTEGSGLKAFGNNNAVSHEFREKGRVTSTEEKNEWQWTATLDYNIGLADELESFIQAVQQFGGDTDKILMSFFSASGKIPSLDQQKYIIQKSEQISAKITNNAEKKLSAHLKENFYGAEKVNAYYIKRAYMDLRDENAKNSINERFAKYSSASAIPPREAQVFLMDIAEKMEIGPNADPEHEESASQTRGVLEAVATGLVTERPGAKEEFQRIFTHLSGVDMLHAENQKDIWNEKNETSLTNHVSRGVEGLMDMVQYGSEAEKVAALGIMITLGLSLFGKGPFKGIQKPLLAVSGAAALGIAAESIYDIDLMGGLKDAFTGRDDTPYDYFIRKHFPMESMLDGRYKGLILEMQEVDMRSLVLWHQDPETKKNPAKTLKKYPTLCKVVDNASGVSNLSQEEKAQAALSITESLFYEVALQTNTMQIGVDENIESATESRKQRNIIKGRNFAEKNLQDRKFGDVLNGFIGMDIMSAKNPVAWLHNFIGGGFENMGDFLKKLQLNNEDEIRAFVKRGINHPQKLQATLAFGRELFNSGKDFVFDAATGIYEWKPVEGKNWSLRWGFTETKGAEISIKLFDAAKGLIEIPIDIAKWFPGMPIMVAIEWLSNYDGDIDKLFGGWYDSASLYIQGIDPDPLATSVEDLRDSEGKVQTPDNWFSEERFGRYADESANALLLGTKIGDKNEKVILKDDALFAVGIVPMEKVAQEKRAAQVHKVNKEARKKAIETVKKYPNINDKLPSDWEKEVSKYQISSSIIEEDGKNYWIVALRVPTQEEDKSAKEMKGFEQLFNEELEKFGKEEVTLKKQKGLFFIEDDITTHELNGQSIPENVDDKNSLWKLLQGEDKNMVTRKEILDAMKNRDDAKWYWPDTSSAERVENFRQYVQEQGEEKDQDYRATTLKTPAALRNTFVGIFNEALFDYKGEE